MSRFGVPKTVLPFALVATVVVAAALAACGGRTLDDGVYDVYARPSPPAGAGTSANGGALSFSGAAAGGGNAVGGSGGAAPGGEEGGSPSGGARSVDAGPVQGCGGTPRANGSLTLIDNMESQSHPGFIDQYEGRKGAWYTFGDGTNGMQSPATGLGLFPMRFIGRDPTGGEFVASDSGANFQEWGAGIGAELNEGCPYDASVYKGLRFYARSDAGTVLFVRMPSATAYTGLGCSSDTCSDVYQTSITLGPSWQEYYVAFNSLAPLTDPSRRGVNAAALLRLEFEAPPFEPFAFSLDDLTFY